MSMGDTISLANHNGDLLVSVVQGTSITQVADLQGLAGKSYSDLMASHSLVV